MTHGLRIRSARKRGAAQQPENSADLARSVGRKRRARKRCRKNALECCKVDTAWHEGRPHYRVFSGYQLPFWASRDFFDGELSRRYGGAVRDVENAVWAQSVGQR